MIEHDERCVTDPLLKEYLLQALRGQLKRSPGHKMSRRPDYVLVMAGVWIEKEKEQVQREIASGKLRRSRGDPGPAEIAADRIAGYIGHTTGRHLLNEISLMRKRQKNMSA